MPKSHADSSDLLDLTGYVRGIARRRAAAQGRGACQLIDELLAEIGVPDLSEHLSRLRQIAATGE